MGRRQLRCRAYSAITNSESQDRQGSDRATLWLPSYSAGEDNQEPGRSPIGIGLRRSLSVVVLGRDTDRRGFSGYRLRRNGAFQESDQFPEKNVQTWAEIHLRLIWQDFVTRGCGMKVNIGDLAC
jgi:hypothetical protein